MEAKKILKYHIKFLESLLKHINGTDKIMQSRAMWTSWCLHRYINDGLMKDIENAICEFGEKKNENIN